MCRRVISVLIFMFTISVSNVSAIIEFKELDDNVVARVNDNEISLDALSKKISESKQHVDDGLHKERTSKIPKSAYLKAMMDKYVIIDDALNLKYDKSDRYMRLEKQRNERHIINKYNNDVVIPLVKKDPNADSRGILEKKVDEYRSKYKIEINNELIKRERLKDSFNNKDVVAKVGDYKITLEDVILKASPYYYDHMNPHRILQLSLDRALSDLVKRALILSEAVNNGFGKDILDISVEEKNNFLIEVYSYYMSRNMEVSPEDIKKRFDEEKGKYFKAFKIRKYGIIEVSDENKIKDIKKRLDDGADFYSIAVKESKEEATKANGGIQGYTNKSNRKIAAVLDTLKSGEVSDVIKLKNTSFTIVKLIDIKYDKYEELKPLIYADIQDIKLKEYKSDNLLKKREAANIIINNKIITADDFYEN